MAPKKPSLIRLAIRLCQRHAKESTPEGDVARRVLEGVLFVDLTPETVEPWLKDLSFMAALAWETNADRYVAPLREQGAAFGVQCFFNQLDTQGFIDRLREERAA